MLGPAHAACLCRLLPWRPACAPGQASTLLLRLLPLFYVGTCMPLCTFRAYVQTVPPRAAHVHPCALQVLPPHASRGACVERRCAEGPSAAAAQALEPGGMEAKVVSEFSAAPHLQAALNMAVQAMLDVLRFLACPQLRRGLLDLLVAAEPDIRAGRQVGCASGAMI